MKHRVSEAMVVAVLFAFGSDQNIANSNYLQDFGITPEIISAGEKTQMGNREKSPLLKVRMFEIECRCMAATSLASWAVFPRIW